ncbi:hypothetical protein Tco_1214289 [Tanacetum coccineum]
MLLLELFGGDAVAVEGCRPSDIVRPATSQRAQYFAREVLPQTLSDAANNGDSLGKDCPHIVNYTSFVIQQEFPHPHLHLDVVVISHSASNEGGRLQTKNSYLLYGFGCVVTISLEKGPGSCGTVYHGLWYGSAKQPPWPNSRGKAINESAASWTKVICLAIKFLKVDSASRSLDDEEEPKWMDREWAKLHVRRLECPHPKEDVEVSEEKTHDIETSQSLQKVEQHLQTLCFSAHRSL